MPKQLGKSKNSLPTVILASGSTHQSGPKKDNSRSKKDNWTIIPHDNARCHAAKDVQDWLEVHDRV